MELQLLNEVTEGHPVLMAVYYEDELDFMEKAKNLGFFEISLPLSDQSVTSLKEQLEGKIAHNNELLTSLEDELRALASQTRQLELLSDQTASEIELKKAVPAMTLDTVYIEGWVRHDRTQRLKKAIEEVTDIYDLDIVDPTKEDIPPTCTVNNEFVTPFETITDMFSKPSFSEVDPNPVMSVWYWILFGMMMGDAGYGLMMFILFYALIKIKKPQGGSRKLYLVFLYSSITTAFWGIIFGSYFGVTWRPEWQPTWMFIEPLKEPMKLLILSLIMGVGHILSGLFLKIYASIRSGNIWDAIFDQVSWVLVVVGLGLLFLPGIFSKVGMVMAISGGLIVLFTGGRRKPSIFGKVTSGIVGLYAVTGYMSDVLSYSRIMALSLSSAVVAMVMNLLAGMIQGSVIGFIFSLFIYIIGHSFNLVMGLLSAYVHDGRLQYIEFFGKFYEGGGTPFKPLSVKLKYINEINNDKIMKGDL